MNNKRYETIKDYIYLTLAVGIIAASVFFFLIPSQAAISSVAGLSIVLSNVLPLPISIITLILNTLLLIIGFILLGKEFGVKTVYTSLLMSLYLAIFEFVFPNNVSLTSSHELDVVCYIIIVSFGSAILFNRNASSGGLDIVAKIMNKYFHMDIGKSMSLAGILIAFTTVFFYDKKIVVLSFLGTYFNGIILDHFIFDHNLKRRVCIISKDIESVRDFIVHDLHSGATLYEAIGAYTNDKHLELITIVDKNEYQKLTHFLRNNDPEAFVTVYTVSDMQYMIKQ